MINNIKKCSFYCFLLAISLLLAQCGKVKVSSQNTLKIGVILSLTGNGSASGDYTLKGIQLAVKEQNPRGGLFNRQIELDIQDSKGDPETGAALAKVMFDQHVLPFMVCTNTSGVSLAVKTETEKNNVLLVASAATDKLLVNSNATVRNFIESEQISAEILKYLGDPLHLNAVGIFYANDEFGNSISTKIAGKASAQNVALPFNVAYSDKDIDYRPLINAQDLTKAPAIYVVGLGNSLGRFIKQLREVGYTGIIIADPLFNNPGIKAEAGIAANGVQFFDFAFYNDGAHPRVQTFVNDYKQEFNTVPENLSAITYDALKIMFQAMEGAKSMDPKTAIKYTENRKYNAVTGEIYIDKGNIIYPTAFKQH